MKKKQKRLVLRSVLLLVIALAVGYTLYNTVFKDTSGNVQVGDQAPNFELTTLNGEKVKLSDFKGKKGVFLNFWGTWCDPCKREMPYMEELYKQYRDKGIEILAVDVGEASISVSDFKKRLHLSFPILMDDSKDVTRLYGIGPIPTTLLINADGKIIEKTSDSLSKEKIEEYMKRIKP
ncbi:thiol-disulfide oxidoreductase [Fictibacillus macauensis ZFHKF-1]|uniref:Thiol-disulfide oxidoreductase n=1 Tax=Fictibacillus macauensis ZFHKF-1 TaxID=1196324 RepID=I8AL17_9BACL|nr:thiol-disulfide oxidoreductase ResA [Fictibacillus macauensis]EIT86547.1 thiol-disulfide oxidoreductase [Fictibacillus macauensis ZFHKF-1]